MGGTCCHYAQRNNRARAAHACRHHWTAMAIAVVATSVSTQTGRFQVWNAESNVLLERAVASSTPHPAVWPPV